MAYTIYVEGCPTTDQIDALANDSDLVTADEQHEMLEHIVDCDICEPKYLAALGLEEDFEVEAPPMITDDDRVHEHAADPGDDEFDLPLNISSAATGLPDLDLPLHEKK